MKQAGRGSDASSLLVSIASRKVMEVFEMLDTYVNVEPRPTRTIVLLDESIKCQSQSPLPCGFYKYFCQFTIFKVFNSFALFRIFGSNEVLVLNSDPTGDQP